jgi:hypothetical protein
MAEEFSHGNALLQILANGAQTNADFAGIGTMPDSYFKGRDEKFKNDFRDKLAAGLPKTPDGQVDWKKTAGIFAEGGQFDPGIKAGELGLAQQKQEFGQQQDAITNPRPGGPPDVPSLNRSGMKLHGQPLNKGGAIGPTSVGGAQLSSNGQGDQPGSIMHIISEAGVPDELAGPLQQEISARIKTDPNVTVDPKIADRVRQAVQEYAQRMRAGQPQQPVALNAQAPPQGQPQAPPSQQAPAPQVAQRQFAPQSGPTDPRFAGLVPEGRSPELQIHLLQHAINSGNLTPEDTRSYQNSIDAIRAAAAPTAPEKDFQASKRNPKLDEFTAQQAADVTSAKGVAESDVKEQDGLIAAGQTASAKLGTLNTMSNIIQSDKNLDLGFGSATTLKIKMALERAGFDTGNLSGAQLLAKFNAALAAESTKGVSARGTNFTMSTFMANNPGIAMDEKGNIRMLGILSQNAKREAEIGALARQNRGNWEKWDNIVQKYDEAHPIKDPTTGKVLSNHSIIAPAETKEGGTALPALEPGKTIVNGHTYKGGDPKIKTNWELKT